MPRVIISDTSCLIVFTKIGELDLLYKMYKSVVITQDILFEYGQKTPDWIQVKKVGDPLKQQLLEMHVDKGEASAISLALESNDSIVILDDWKARKVAKSLGLAVTGTLGVIVKAKNKGIIPSIVPFLNKKRNKF